MDRWEVRMIVVKPSETDPSKYDTKLLNKLLGEGFEPFAVCTYAEHKNLVQYHLRRNVTQMEEETAQKIAQAVEELQEMIE